MKNFIIRRIIKQKLQTFYLFTIFIFSDQIYHIEFNIYFILQYTLSQQFRMELIELLRKILLKMSLTKKLFLFAFSLCSYLPPFRHLKHLINNIYEKLKQAQKKIVLIGNSKSPLNFIFQVYRQTFLVFALTITLALCAYVRLFKNNKKNLPKSIKKPSDILSQVDNIEEKSILRKNKMKRLEEKEEIDSCLEQLQNNLCENVTHQDKVFLQILKRYQGIHFQNQKPPQFNRIFSEIQQNTNKYAFDNSSTEEGYIKTSSKNIPNSPWPKKADDLNRSSVL